MKMKFVWLTFIFVTIISVGISYASPGDSLIVKIAIKNRNVNRMDDLVISLSLESKSHKGIVIPKYLSWGGLTDSTGDGYISVELQRLENHIYKNVPIEGIIDNMPSMDQFDTLKFNKVRADGFFFGSSFRRKKGEYRVRVLCFLSSTNPGFPDLFSNWFYFRCVRDIPHPMK